MSAVKAIKQPKNHQTRGVVASVLSAFFQGSEGFVVSFFGLVASLSIYVTTGELSIVVLVLKELLVALILCLIYYRKLSHVLKKLPTKKAFVLMASGLATAIGNCMFLFGVTLASSSYGSVLTSLYPIFTVLIIRLILKERQPLLVWVGMTIAFISSFMFLLLPTLINQSGFDWRKIVGMVMGMLAAFFWAIEGNLIQRVYQMQQEPHLHFDEAEIIVIRSVASTLSSWILILPFAFIFSNPFAIMKLFLISWEAWLIILAISLCLIIMRFALIYGIKIIGIKPASIISNNAFLVTSLLSWIFSYANWKMANTNEPLFEGLIWYSWLLVIPMGLGTWMVLNYSKMKPSIQLPSH